MSEAMTINDIINQLGSLRASSAEFAKSDPENEIWQADVAACETAIRILAALSGAGCTDLETTLDFLQDYYKKNGIAPMVRILSKNTGYKLKEVYELFPSGPGKGACKMAGLPKPTGCV